MQFDVVGGKLIADAGAVAPTDSLEVGLVENALVPGAQKLALKAAATTPGRVLAGGSSGATLYQGDGIVVEEFALRGLDQLAAFDAGSFLLAAPE